MSILSDFYHGKVVPFEDFTCADIPQVVELHNEIKKAEDELLHSLNEEQKKAYDKIRADLLEVSCIELEEMFKMAFTIGVQMGAEIYG